MNKNDQGQDVRDEKETRDFVRDAHRDGLTEAELIAHAKANGIPGFVAKRIRKELELTGELADEGRARIRQA